MILVEGTIRVGDRLIPIRSSFFTPGGATAFIKREKKLGNYVKVVDEDYHPIHDFERK